MKYTDKEIEEMEKQHKEQDIKNDFFILKYTIWLMLIIIWIVLFMVLIKGIFL